MEPHKIICPNCKEEIALSEVLVGPIEEQVRQEMEKENRIREEDLRNQMAELVEKESAMEESIKSKLALEREKLEKDLDKKLSERYGKEIEQLNERLRSKDERIEKGVQNEIELRKKERDVKEREMKLEEEVRARIRKEEGRIKADLEGEVVSRFSARIEEMETIIREKDENIRASRQHEMELRKVQREMEEKDRKRELEFQRKLDLGRREIEKGVMDRLGTEHQLKEAERDKIVADLKDQISILKSKAEQGSQQLQGEVLELELEGALRSSFPFDSIEEVPKGIRGADIIQRVYTENRMECGTIIWELKRTRNWSDGWITKLKDDQRELSGDIAVLCTAAMPREVREFGTINGVMVTSHHLSLPIAGMLRTRLIDIARMKRMSDGSGEKKDLLYEYLTGNEFRQRMEAVVETFVGMKSDMDAEKRAFTKLWSKREKQMLRALHNLSSLYGSMHGIVGASLPRIETLELEQLTGNVEKRPLRLDEYQG